MKFSKFFFFFCLFIVTLLSTYLIHVKFFKVDVVFYSSIIDGLIAVTLSSLILFTSNRYKVFDNFEKTLIVFTCLLFSYIFAISVPTVIDRSLSFYLLEKIHQQGGHVKFSSFEDIFTMEYMHEHRLVDVRLTEQQASGTISIEDGCVSLTERGQKIAAFSRFFRKNLLPKQRLLMGQYTADLTDPFRTRNNIVVEQNKYACEFDTDKNQPAPASK